MITRLIGWSLENRLIILAIAAAILIGGTIVAVKMPVDVFPDLTAPSVTVITEAHGMAPEEVETLVTFPIETAVNGASGVRRVRSSTATGISVVWVEFDWGTDIYQARQIVSEKLQLAAGNLPPEAQRPALAPVSSIMGEIMFISLTGDKHTPMDLRSTADWAIRPRLLSVPGVSQVTPIGGDIKEYQVNISPERLAAAGVSLSQVIAAVKGTNQNTSAGFYVEGGQEYLIHGVGRVTRLEDIANTVVALNNGRPVLVSHLAEVRIGPAIKRGEGSAQGKPAVILAMQKQPGANTLTLTKELDRTLEDIQKTLPKGMTIDRQIFRQADFIQVSIDNVLDALRDGAIVVVVILLLFLMNLRATFIALLAIPLSLLAAVLTLKFFGATINTMTLGGMAIAIGALVDDAIIDVENVFRRLRENAKLEPSLRQNPIVVTLRASLEIRSSITFATFIIMLVFVPLFFLSGVEGRLLAPLGVAYVVALFASLIVAASVTPVLCSLLLPNSKGVTEGEDSPVVRRLKSAYQRTLAVVIQRSKLIIAVAFALFLATLATLPFMGRAFLPEFNEGTLTINAVTLPGTSLEESNRLGQMVESVLLSFPEVKSTARRTGRAELDEHAQGVEAAEIDVGLKMQQRSKEEFLTELRRALTAVPGMNITIGQPISHRIDHMLSGTRANIAVKIFGDDLRQLRTLAQQLQNIMAKVPGVVDLSIEQQTDIPILGLRFDRERIARVGLKVEDVAEAVETTFLGRTVSRVLEGQRSFDLVVRAEDANRQSVEAIRATLIDTPLGGKVPLASLADVKKDLGPNTISRENVQRKIVVGANVAGRDLQGVVRDIQDNVTKAVSLPRGYYVSYGGQFESAEEAAQTIAFLSVLVIAGIVLLLAAALRSLRDALIILVNLPLALIGGIFGIFLSGGVLNVASMIGLITLFGIAARNGIMMVSHIRHLMQEENESFERAVERGALERLSPILMTALCAGLALLPLVLRGGEPGSEILTPMAIVILAGLFSSTALNMIVVPALYLRFGRPMTEESGAMSPRKILCFPFVLLFVLAANRAQAAEVPLDLPAALQRALRDNPELKAKRHSLGIAQGRAQQAGLMFQNNPRFSVEVESPTSGRSDTSVELNLHQELEIAGQRGHRFEAAEKNLTQAKLSIEDAERLLRLEVTRTFYNLLAVQQSIGDLKEILLTQENLLQAGDKRFAREDITILELNTLRLDRDQVRNELANKLRERVTIENELRRLVGLQEEGSLMLAGDLLEILRRKRDAIPDRQKLQACSVANRADLKAAKLAVEVREAELRLAQARRIPNISLGPRYKRETNQNVVGGEIAIPLPFFNRNQEEITTALANQNVSKAELEGRTMSIKQQLDSTYTKLTLANERMEAYGSNYLGDLEKMLALTRKAYESGEMTIFEFSVTRDRFTQARARSLDAALAYVQTMAELEAQAPGCLQ